MNTKRLRAIGKLGLLAGLPVGILVGLFSTGVYYGATYRYDILKFEHDWLGLDVEVPDPPPVPEEPEAEEATPASGEAVEGSGEASGEAPDDATPAREEPPVPTPAAPAAKEAPTGTFVGQQPQAPPTIEELPAEPAKIEGALAERLALPVTVTVKVLVDDELVEAHPAWIDYVQRTVSLASQSYIKQFGIQLELSSVGRWPVATQGLDAPELLEDIESRPREGADILLGMTHRPLDGTRSGRAEIPDPNSPFNGAYAVVYAVPEQSNPHLRTLIHELSHLFGAHDIVDPEHADYQSGSWMSYAPPERGSRLWIDAENRRRILERKDKPFRPEAQADE